MALPTVPVTCVVADQFANPIANATVQMTLNATDVYEGFIVQTTVQDVTDATGTVVLDVFPNALGSMGTQYKVLIVTPERTIKALAVQAQAAAMESQQVATTNANQAALSAASAAMSALSASQTAFNAAASMVNAQAAATLAASYGASLTATSVTPLSIGSGPKTITIQTGKQFILGQWVILVEQSNTANWMAGPITALTGLSLTFNATSTGGAGGPYTDWALGVSGAQGPQGVQGIAGSLPMMAAMAIVLG